MLLLRIPITTLPINTSAVPDQFGTLGKISGGAPAPLSLTHTGTGYRHVFGIDLTPQNIW